LKRRVRAKTTGIIYNTAVNFHYEKMYLSQRGFGA